MCRSTLGLAGQRRSSAVDHREPPSIVGILAGPPPLAASVNSGQRPWPPVNGCAPPLIIIYLIFF